MTRDPEIRSQMGGSGSMAARPMPPRREASGHLRLV
jgi:hypothetical protein